jgi:hypothetical protein
MPGGMAARGLLIIKFLPPDTAVLASRASCSQGDIMKSSNRLPLYFFAGLALLLGMEICILLRADPVTTWATPVLWSGLILALDAVLYAKRGNSLIKSGSIVPVAVISVAGWWVFEWFNIFLSNWHYINLTSPLIVRYAGYAWAFATITPGILLVYAMFTLFITEMKGRPLRVTRAMMATSFITGLFFLAIPAIPFSMYYTNRAADPELFFWLQWSANTFFSEYAAAFVWVGFVLLLEPLNFSMGNPSLAGALSRGDYRPLAGLSAAGLLCGFLWEFWNYWAYTKWYYTVPILGHVKLFEMPVLGYLGFIPFAWELYNMVSLLSPRAIAVVEGRPT